MKDIDLLGICPRMDRAIDQKIEEIDDFLKAFTKKEDSFKISVLNENQVTLINQFKNSAFDFYISEHEMLVNDMYRHRVTFTYKHMHEIQGSFTIKF